MVPTLDPGDRVLVARFLYHFATPARGDIVVFRYPLDTHIVFIKRVIGRPGDTLSLRDGYVYVNGIRQNEPYVAKVDGKPSPPYTVPAGTYFMMGDNRLDSDDSRVWGPVPARDLIGRAFLIYWPVTRIGLP
jgi:signal peptidase I